MYLIHHKGVWTQRNATVAKMETVGENHMSFRASPQTGVGISS